MFIENEQLSVIITHVETTYALIYIVLQHVEYSAGGAQVIIFHQNSHKDFADKLLVIYIRNVQFPQLLLVVANALLNCIECHCD